MLYTCLLSAVPMQAAPTMSIYSPLLPEPLMYLASQNQCFHCWFLSQMVTSLVLLCAAQTYRS